MHRPSDNLHRWISYKQQNQSSSMYHRTNPSSTLRTKWAVQCIHRRNISNRPRNRYRFSKSQSIALPHLYWQPSSSKGNHKPREAVWTSNHQGHTGQNRSSHQLDTSHYLLDTWASTDQGQWTGRYRGKKGSTELSTRQEEFTQPTQVLPYNDWQKLNGNIA